MQRRLKWSGLQARMTFSYVWVTVISVLLLEILVFSLFALIAIKSREADLVSRVDKTAQREAHLVSTNFKGSVLSSHSALILGNRNFTNVAGVRSTNNGDFVVPYIDTPKFEKEAVTFALLIAPNKQVVVSSYPLRYRVGSSIAQLLADRNVQFINNALAGRPGGTTSDTFIGNGAVFAVEPVWSRGHTVLGVLYVQVPLEITWPMLFLLGSGVILGSGFLLLMVTVPLGALFGLIATRSLVGRLHGLISATTSFANGNYSQRVRVRRRDEVGQLEDQFNRMAEQLVVSITKQKELVEQNAILAERSRISRELHDAISQDLFSLRMLAGGLQTAVPTDSPLYPQIATLEQTTTNTIREMRALLLELRPTQLEHLGLVESLEDIANAYRTRLGITVTTNITSVPLSPKIEHALLRITQEAMANAARHSNATTITLSLVPTAYTVELTVTDNGKGFQSGGVDAQHGLGLRLMQERIHELNGTLLLQSAPCQGTRVYVCLPQELKV